MIRVRCADGHIRHKKPFKTMREADHWAWWGHCCTSEHTFERYAPEEARCVTT